MEKRYVASGKYRPGGLYLQLMNTKLHYKDRFSYKPKQKETKEAKHVTQLVGLGCSFHQAHPEFLQRWAYGMKESLSRVARSYLLLVKVRRCSLDHLSRLCCSGQCSNTSCGNVDHQDEKSLRPVKRDFLKPRPTSSRREAKLPPEAGKPCVTSFLQPMKAFHRSPILTLVLRSAHLNPILTEGKHSQKVGDLWHGGTDILSFFWKFAWQLEINMQINQITGTVIAETSKMDGLRDYNNVEHLLNSYI